MLQTCVSLARRQAVLAFLHSKCLFVLCCVLCICTVNQKQKKQKIFLFSAAACSKLHIELCDDAHALNCVLMHMPRAHLR